MTPDQVVQVANVLIVVAAVAMALAALGAVGIVLMLGWYTLGRGRRITQHRADEDESAAIQELRDRNPSDLWSH